MTPEELAALPELPAEHCLPTDGSATAVDIESRGFFIPWRTPDDPVCIHDEQGRAWQVVRMDLRRWKLRRPQDDIRATG